MIVDDDDAQPAAADEAATEAAETDASEADEGAALEADARKQGWVPRDEFRGDPGDWTPADEYVRMGDPKYLRKALKDTRKAVTALEKAREADKTEFGERLERFERMSKAQRAKLYADIEAERRKAVKDGDEDRYEELNRAEAALYEQEQAAEKPAAKKTQEAAQQPHPDVERWVSENPWFTADEELNMAAQGAHLRITKQEPGLSLAENLAKVRTEVIKRFPEKFGKSAKPQTNGHTAVEGGQRMPAAKAAKGWAEIPAEDKSIIKRHIEEGLYKDQADAAKSYWKS